ncbi:hypothetical protein AB0F72_17670 [Actinoplanes sp. NPDC023936]|uniref:hypothetical protein n=1 Tax=Actinoplanes sp. NPDC023936 TaxID=3154910 RepID=UPI00340F686B
MGIRTRPRDQEYPELVRPYTPLYEPVDPGRGGTGPAAPGTGAAADDAETTVETAPTGAQLTRAYRDANRPREFLPLPRYRPDLEDLAPPTSLVVPGQRFVGRSAVPDDCLVAVPRQRSSSAVVWGTGPNLLRRPGPDPGADTVVIEQQRQRARCEAARILTELGAAWADQWADLPVDTLPDFERGGAQLPLLTAASMLAALVATMPSVFL